MKLLTFRYQGRDRLGWLQEDQKTVLSVDPANRDMPHSILDVIKRGPYARNQIRSSAEQLDSHSIDDLAILEPIVPGAIFCVGLNYADHISEVKKAESDKPTIFLDCRAVMSHMANH